jgi:hypothetical protein
MISLDNRGSLMNSIVDFDTSLPPLEEDADRYHARRAHQERSMAENAVTSDARRSHTEMALYHETMAVYGGSAAHLPGVGPNGSIGAN